MNKKYHATIPSYLNNPNSLTYRAFMDGARHVLTALQLLPKSEWPFALSVENDAHILALLDRRAELIDQRRREDAQHIISLYGYNRYELAAFFLDVPKLNEDGLVCTSAGTVLEDQPGHLRPNVGNPGWPRRTIVSCAGENDRPIPRDIYRRLSLEERENYNYIRIFILGIDHENLPKHRIQSDDTVMMEELIRALICIGDPIINRRLLDAATPPVSDDDRYDDLIAYPLCHYKGIILDTLNELAERNSRPAEWISRQLSITPKQQDDLQERLRQLGYLAANDDPFQV